MAETPDPQPPGRGKTVVLTFLLTTLFWTVVWGGFTLARGRPQPVAFAVQPPPATATPAPTATSSPSPTAAPSLTPTAAEPAMPASRAGSVVLDMPDGDAAAAASEEELAAIAATPTAAAPVRSAGAILVNINTATQAELESLPGIGPKTAEAIIAFREANGPFATIEALTDVKGIGPATLEKLRALITVD